MGAPKKKEVAVKVKKQVKKPEVVIQTVQSKTSDKQYTRPKSGESFRLDREVKRMLALVKFKDNDSLHMFKNMMIHAQLDYIKSKQSKQKNDREAAATTV